MNQALAGLLGLALAAATLRAAPAPVPAAGPATRAEVKQKIQGTQQDLSKLRKEIKQGKQEVLKHARQEKSLLGELQQLSRKLEVARRDARTQVFNLGLVEDKLTRVRSRLELLQAEEAADRDALKGDLSRLYKARARRGPALLFAARTPAELSTRARYLGALSGATQRRVRGLQDRIAQVDGYRREYSEQQDVFKRRKEDVEQARRQVEVDRQRKEALLKDVRGRKAKVAELVREKELSAGRLQGLLDGFIRESSRLARQRQTLARPSKAGSRSSLRGRLPWPAFGRLISRYGKQTHPIFRTPVFNRGIEVGAPYGSPIKAVASGTVLHAAEMEGFGNLVVVDHGGGMMSVYGYASQVHVQAGQAVGQGELLADVGEAGTSGQPSLYFEIRQGAKAQDPLRYLGRR